MFHSSPVSRFVALRQLADASDRLAQNANPARDLRHGDASIGVFTRLVRSQLAGSLLRYSVRQKLIAQARHLGISRFDANLIIAAVMHHGPLAEVALPLVGKAQEAPRMRGWRGGAGLVAATLVVQAGIALAIWAMLF
jgi:hypothetical protein